ncbi:MAG: SpoIIE family protein phosphatase [bacterium]|nr:SpoIIE family protein phosphatase [bacterium]
MRISFGIQIGLAIFSLAVGMTGVSLYYFYDVSRTLVLDQMRTRMRDLGNTGAMMFTPEDRKAIARLSAEIREAAAELTPDARRTLEADEYWESLEPAEAEAFHASADFQQIVQTLRRIKAGSLENALPYQAFRQASDDPTTASRMKFAYMLISIPEYPEYDALNYIADSDYAEVDMNDNGVIDEDEEPNPIGNYWYGDEPIFKQAFRGSSGSAREWYTDRWGTWLSSATPIFDSNGRVLAVLGLDLDVAGAANRLDELRDRLWILLGISVVLSLLVSVLLARFLHRPIEALRVGAERVRARDFDTFIVVRRKDELGLLADAFNDMVIEIRGYARTLEKKVEERTARLQETLRQVQSLKEQQDGDYYLTNLLADPLFKNWNISDRVRTDFQIQQKKTFLFRKKPGELGGDLCVTGNLMFRDRRYVMFLNADAMGKSMQGAGGALVTGTVINSIMHRSAGPEVSLDQSPEDWLRSTFHELHSVLSSFDGSMAVSCFLGLIDEESGRLLFFNAEHPHPILIRDGKVAFTSEENRLYKLGMPQAELLEQDFVETLQLQPGDALIVGSDGKDDLRVSDEGGEAYIRHDDTRILDICEKAGGSLEGIVAGISEVGEITDDLSLIRVEYLAASSAGGEVAADAPPAASEDSVAAAADLIRGKDYAAALELLEAAGSRGASSGMLYNYYTGLCLNKLGRGAEALEYLERAANLNRRQSAVPDLLGQVYYKLGRYQEAGLHWRQALKLNPGSKRLEQALARLDRHDKAVD